jgi:hypothetical protein
MKVSTHKGFYFSAIETADAYSVISLINAFNW